ncbi:MAG: TauD/TfdA family dioxygenase [Oligoflexales bacterium]
MIDRNFFMTIYRQINQHSYEALLENRLSELAVFQADAKDEELHQVLKYHGFLLLKFSVKVSLDTVRARLTNLLGEPVRDSGVEDSLHTTIASVNQGRYFSNSCYTQPLHMDDAHCHQIPRLITLHCVRPANKGGVSTLLKFADIEEQILPSYADVFEKLFDKNCLRIRGMKGELNRPLLEHLEEDYLGMAFPAILEGLSADARIEQLYREVYSYIHNPKNQIRFSMKPNEVLIIDNFRTFHGRTSFPASSSRLLYRTCFPANTFRK